MLASNTILRSAARTNKASLSSASLSFGSSNNISIGSMPRDRPAAGRLIDVSDLAEDMRSSVRDYTRMHDGDIKVIGILAHDYGRSDAELYSERIQSTCQEDGLTYEVCRVAGERPQDVEAAIQAANSRDDVHGILVYYPIFKHRELWSRGPYKNQLTGVYYKTHDDYLRDVVAHSKDVEGLSYHYNARWLFRAQAKLSRDQNSNIIYPCTALSVLRILDSQEHEWAETTITIVNRSEIFGRPLAAMLANRGAMVYSIDEDCILLFRSGGRLRRCTDMDLDCCMRHSSIVISAVPTPQFSLPICAIQPGTTVVNVSEYSNVDEDAILGIPGAQFIPQVGKVTVAMLEQNLINLHQRWQHDTKDLSRC